VITFRAPLLAVSGLAALIAGTLAAPGAAEADPVKATAHFERGTRLYQVGEYAQALEAFKAGHLEEPDPSFLFNIAQAHRQLGHPREAITFYRRFLSLDPATPMRADVERRIRDLEAEANRPSAPIPPPPRPLAFSPAAGHAESKAAPAGDLSRRDAGPAPEGPSRWPVWVGGALTVGLAGAATAVSLTTRARYEDLATSCGKRSAHGTGCPVSDVDRIQTRARIVNGLWGLTALSAVVTGVGFYLTSPGEPAAAVAFRF